MIRLYKETYKKCKELNLVMPDRAIIFVTELPWYKSWFGLKPTRVKFGDGKTKFNKLKFL